MTTPTPALPPPLPPLPRAGWINVVAWITLVLCGIGVLMIGLEVLAYQAFSHTPAFETMRQHLMAKPESAALMATVSRWLPGILVLSLLWSTVAIVASIGLLKRREWGRRLFVGLLVFGVLWQGVAIPMQWWLTDALRAIVLAFADLSKESEQLRLQLDASLSSSHASGLFFGLVFAGLYGWLAWMLRTPRVRAEFVARGAAHDAVPV